MQTTVTPPADQQHQCTSACTSLDCYRKYVNLEAPDGRVMTFEEWQAEGQLADAEEREHERREVARQADATDADEPPTAVELLSEEYGEGELGNDRNPTHDEFVRWMAEQLIAARAEIAHRDEPPATVFSAEPGRADYIAGLRALAETLELHPELELPYTGRGSAFNVIPHENQREQVAAWARVMHGTKRKGASGDGSNFYLDGKLAGLNICVIATRSEVCERVVVGTREVIEEAPDPDAVAALPKVTQTRTEEIVEWRCSPVLADTQAPDRAAASETNLSPGSTEARDDAPAAPVGGATSGKSGPTTRMHNPPPGAGGPAGDPGVIPDGAAERYGASRAEGRDSVESLARALIPGIG